MQLPDGGWNIYYGGPSEVNATIKAYLALKLAGVRSPIRACCGRAKWRCIFGGVPRMNTFSKLYLALHRPVSVGIRADDSLRSDAHRQMVSREFLGHEQLVARHARAAGHHQPFQAHPPGPRWTWTSFIPKASTNATSRSRPTRKNFLAQFFPVARPAAQVRREWFAEHKIHPFRKTRAEKMRAMDARTLRRQRRPGRDFPGDAQFAHRAQGAGLSRRPSAGRPRAHELKKLEHETADSVRIEPCFSPVWDTAIVAICLHESGIPENHPALKKAAEWLMDREIRFRGDWSTKTPRRSSRAAGF
jgi:squalene-hopene/tetraprenyl-beta-curcumene cyclase